MTAKAHKALDDELGSRPPDGLQALAAADLRELAGLLRDAKRRQSEELEAAIEEALEIVPRMARGPVRKILFG